MRRPCRGQRKSRAPAPSHPHPHPDPIPPHARPWGQCVVNGSDSGLVGGPPQACEELAEGVSVPLGQLGWQELALLARWPAPCYWCGRRSSEPQSPHPLPKAPCPRPPGLLTQGTWEHKAWPPLQVHSPFSPSPCSVSKTAPPPLPHQHAQCWDRQARSLLGAHRGGTHSVFVKPSHTVLLSLLLPTQPLPRAPAPPSHGLGAAWGPQTGPVSSPSSLPEMGMASAD